MCRRGIAPGLQIQTLGESCRVGDDCSRVVAPDRLDQALAKPASVYAVHPVRGSSEQRRCPEIRFSAGVARRVAALKHGNDLTGCVVQYVAAENAVPMLRQPQKPQVRANRSASPAQHQKPHAAAARRRGVAMIDAGSGGTWRQESRERGCGGAAPAPRWKHVSHRRIVVGR